MGLVLAEKFMKTGVGRTPMIARETPGGTEYVSRITGHKFVVSRKGSGKWHVSCPRLNLDETCLTRAWAMSIIEIEDCLG